MTPYLRVDCLLLSDLVDLERMVKVLPSRQAIVEEVSNLQTSFIFCLFLVQGELEVPEGHLLVDIELSHDHVACLLPFCAIPVESA